MEKNISEEEKIRRAEELSARRKNRIPVNEINKNKSKKLTLFGRMSIQVIGSICIFGIFYFISQNNSYAIEQIKPILSTDTDFLGIYNQIESTIKEIDNKIKPAESNNTNHAVENSLENETNIIENNQIVENETAENTTIEEKSEIVNNENTILSDVDYIKTNAKFIKPLNGNITSKYGERTPTDVISENHAGVDIGANTGTDIVASMEGMVEVVSSDGDYGNHLMIKNGEVNTLYAHCSKIVVNQGDYVGQGQKIAEVGSTGKSTGPHLHFEIRRNNTTVNPQDILEL